MNDYQVEVEENESRGSFYIEIEGKRAAEMTFSKAGDDRIIIDHTGVDSNFRDQGLGELLVQQAVAYARRQQIAIIPLCPFARSVFEKNEELRDVL